MNANIEKNLDLAIKLFESASNNNIFEASLELLEIYSNLYIKCGRNDTDLYNKINSIILQIQKDNNYNIEIKRKIDNVLKDVMI